jgi:monofunctional biosynthetic peptidoglycan transglycosylase
VRRAALLLAAIAFAGLVGTVLVAWLAVARIDVGSLARHAPDRTALMLQRESEAKARGRVASVDQRWVPYGSISPLLRRALLIAEDDAFFAHGGLDWSELQASARRNLEDRRITRGGSTITQQLAKNLFLGTERTPTRKLEEMMLAVRMERALSKRRIFELYLNLIEWGDGFYGAEAASRRLFGVPASELDARQALLLAAIVINPRRFSALEPSRRIERRVRMIATRMRRRGSLDEAQYAAAIGRPLPVEPAPAPIDSLPTFEPAPGDSPAPAPAQP